MSCIPCTEDLDVIYTKENGYDKIKIVDGRWVGCYPSIIIRANSTPYNGEFTNVTEFLKKTEGERTFNYYGDDCIVTWLEVPCFNKKHKSTKKVILDKRTMMWIHKEEHITNIKYWNGFVTPNRFFKKGTYFKIDGQGYFSKDTCADNQYGSYQRIVKLNT